MSSHCMIPHRMILHRMTRHMHVFGTLALLTALTVTGCGDPPVDEIPTATPPVTPTAGPTASPTVTPPAATAVLEFSPSSLNFGPVETGTSETRTLTLRNDGTASATVTFALDPASPAFGLSSVSAEVAAGGSVEVEVSFSPTDESPYSTLVTATAGEVGAAAEVRGEGVSGELEDLDGDGFSASDGDCNDEDDTVYPEAPELCDGLDNDCDSIADEDSPTWYPDGDGDGFGGTGTPLEVCDPGAGYALVSGDCDDTDTSINPNAPELCDGIDQDCDTLIDEDLPLSTYYLDADQDGFGTDETVSSCGPVAGASALSGDCNDTSNTVYPGALEPCDGVDNDCDNAIDEDGATTYYVDQDGDGHGNPESPVVSCDATGLSTLNDDCDDSNATTYTGATELCDGSDNNCDGQADEDALLTFYRDADVDGFGASDTTATGCTAPEGYVDNAIDCNDADVSINPGASETCDLKDNNCNGGVDEGVGTSFYTDSDQDGFGDDALVTVACTAPEGTSAMGGDCDDADDLSYPGATEICDGADNDCDSSVDEGVTSAFYPDGDGDGVGTGTSLQACAAPTGYAALTGDCNDADQSIYPGAPETCDTKDNDCDALIDEEGESAFYRDFDGDGFGDETVSKVGCTAPSGYVANGTDCNDKDAKVNPNASETCNSKDDNCNDLVDEGVLTTWYLDADSDGFGRASGSISACTAPSGDYTSSGGDCNDLDNTIYPGAAESCNAKDDDCDTLTDEGVTKTYYADVDKDGYGNLANTTQACSVPTGYATNSTDCNDAVANIYPGAPELCDGADNDCDTQVDEGAKTTYYLDADGDGYGLTNATLQACTVPTGYAAKSGDCDDAVNTTYPGATELCDSKDNDCDTQIDEGVKVTYYYDADRDGYGDPGSDVPSCTAPSTRYVTNDDDCNDLDANINPGKTEICNGKDDNCDNKTDDVDADADGYKATACGGNDCNDNDAYVNVGATEICDGVDDDCDGTIDESDPDVDFSTDPDNCGGCGITCGSNGQGPTCLNGNCGSMPTYQHRFNNVTSIPTAAGWTTLTGSSSSLKTSGGPLEIELSIPLVGGSHSTCRPTIDGKWAGFYESLPETYIWHEGLDNTGYGSGTVRRLWNRTRVYKNIPAGTHTLAVQCRTDSGTLTAGRTGSTALTITREYLGKNKVYQTVSLKGSTMTASSSMTKVPETDLTVTTTSSKLEVTISLPIGNGGHAGCLEWMDGAPIPSTPAYANAYWYAGLEATYYGWIQWHHTRTYTGITPGTHTFSIRCYNDSGTLNIGLADAASVIIVRELDETLYPSSQALDAYANGWDINGGIDSNWYNMPAYSTTITVTRGNLDIAYHVQYYNIASGQYLTCRPMIDGQWAGTYAGRTFTSNEEEGSEHEVLNGAGWYGMLTRRRVYTNISPGSHTVSLQCLSSGASYYVGYYAVGSLLARDVDVIADN